MAEEQPWKAKGMKKADWLKEEVAKAVGAGKPWDCETVDFSDPNRPLTCIEVDFPIIPINQIAAIEGNAGKPIYQMSKWWARRRSSVFRSMLLASAIKAPDDPSDASKIVWDSYYGNHEEKGAFKKLKVGDIFMGGGTTVVEGSRLGMQMFGNDLNPVAWFVVKNELADVDKTEVEALLADIEAEVKPQIMPFYACDCPRGHKGKWTQVGTGEAMSDDLDPLAMTPKQRKDYSYLGPEIIYAFWAKHGSCQVTGCGHRTPIITNPVMAIKTLSVKAWACTCATCGCDYDLEGRDARMAPRASLVVADSEHPYSVAVLSKHDDSPESADCPRCGKTETYGLLGKGRRKKIELSLLIHPEWLQGEPSHDAQGEPYGGCSDDPVEETIRWNQARAANCQLIEVRGTLPDEIICPESGAHIRTGVDGGTVPKKSKLACGSCGSTEDVLKQITASGKTAPLASYALQGFCPSCKEEGQPYGGRFFDSASQEYLRTNAAIREWTTRSYADGLVDFLPSGSIPAGLETSVRTPLQKYGYTTWDRFFNERQRVVIALIAKHLHEKMKLSPDVAMFVAGGLQQFSRSFNLFSIWNIQADKLEPFLSKNNFQPPTRPIENNAFGELGRGNFLSSKETLLASIDWKNNPWELVSATLFEGDIKRALGKGKSVKTYPNDPVRPATITCSSSSNLSDYDDSSLDLVITDPPFGDIMQYAELSGIFYRLLRPILGSGSYFSNESPPIALEAVENYQRHKDKSKNFYKKSLTACWMEAERILKPGGLLAFTFHHDKDGPWVAVLESLFDAGFYLQCAFPIRSDETKGEGGTPGTFGAQKVEYDIIHVCRKRQEEPKPISWAKLRRQVLHDVRHLKELLEHHQEDGLPEADLQVIRRGKALEYFSRHYGKVYKNQDAPMSVLEALLGINLLLDEEAGGIKEAPPHKAEPFTRMLLRLFDGANELPRDQFQKFLRGTGIAPSDFANRGWVYEEKKIFYLTSPLALAQEWTGKHRRGLQSDYDQAMFLIGACFEGSGINASETLSNENFKPHTALSAILTWFKTHGADSSVRNAAITATQLYRNWESKNQTKVQQLSFFDDMGEVDI